MYVVDTCIKNWLVDGMIDPAELPTDGQLLASHVQIDELNNTKDDERRAKLLAKFTALDPAIVLTESFVLDISQLDMANVGDGVTYRSLKDALDLKNGGKENNVEDALIAEVAIKNKFTLLTTDGDLKDVVESHGGKVRFWSLKCKC